VSKTKKKKKATSLWRAFFDSRHFAWEAYGNTREEALDVLRKILRENTEWDDDEIDELMDEDAHAYQVHAGLGLRDDYAIVVGPGFDRDTVNQVGDGDDEDDDDDGRGPRGRYLPP